LLVVGQLFSRHNAPRAFQLSEKHTHQNSSRPAIIRLHFRCYLRGGDLARDAEAAPTMMHDARTNRRLLSLCASNLFHIISQSAISTSFSLK
jgi:hypothetical protein